MEPSAAKAVYSRSARRFPHPPPASTRSAFTLIELILVLSLLMIVMGISLPTLKNFFRSRTIDSEARRFLSLTRYAQSRAATEGVPMVLWIDAQDGTYGLQAETGFLDVDRKAVIYDIDNDLSVEVSSPPLITSSSVSGSTSSSSLSPRQRTTQANANLPAIRVNAEGFFDETSPETVVFQQANTDAPQTLWITQTGNRLNYEIRASQPATYRR